MNGCAQRPFWGWEDHFIGWHGEKQYQLFPMIGNSFSVIFAIASIHGFILSLFLLRKEFSPPNKVLALLLSFTSLDLLIWGVTLSADPLEYPILNIYKIGTGFFYGPTIYLYTVTLTTGRNLRPRDIWHYLPFALVKFDQIILVGSNFSQLHLLFNDTGCSIQCYIRNYTMGPHSLLYTFLSIFTVYGYRKRVRSFFSNADKMGYTWLYILLFFYFWIWIIPFVALYTGLNRDMAQFNVYMFSMASTLIFVLGYFAMFENGGAGYAPNLAADESYSLENIGNGGNGNGLPQGMNRSTSSGSSEKYVKTKLAEEKKKSIQEKLEEYMKEKPWKESELTIKDISNKIEVPIHHISQVINDLYGENFFTFINNYRIAEAKKMLLEKSRDETNILHIAYASGFNSKTTFNSCFKKNTGFTPTQFRERNG